MRISRAKLIDKIRKTDKFYSVSFVTRTNKNIRHMNCRNRVVSHLSGGEQPYNAVDHHLITTYSIDSNGYRNIPEEGIVGACVEGVTYLVND
jgi:hypothetical protein